MEQIKKFLRDKGFALALLACLVAAGAAGVWAVRAARDDPALRGAGEVGAEVRRVLAHGAQI